jgi:thiamine-phosphate pyrophosphorylase
MKEQLPLYLVTNRYGAESDFLATIEQACQNGITMVQLREKELSTRAFYALAQKVKAITDRYQVPLIINDRVDICLAVDAAGVHIGDEELPVAVTRQLIGKRWLGVSAKTVERAREAEKEGADYLGVGAIFPTKTKVITRETSVETLKEIVQTVHLPVVAIGGITEERLGTFAQTGIAGIAVVSEIMLAENVGEKVRNLRSKINALEGCLDE